MNSPLRGGWISISAEQRKTRPRVVLTVTIFVLVMLLAGLCFGAEQRAAVVRLDGCSGVCVSPDGLILSAKHCDVPQRTTVTFDGGRQASAQRVYVASGSEGPVVLEADGQEFPHVSLAAGPPEKGEKVFSLGYPGGHFAWMEGEVLGGTSLDGMRVNVTDHRVLPGNSGGPLFNAQGELIGLASAASTDKGPARSYWITWTAIRQALDAVGRSEQPAGNLDQSSLPILYVFTSALCGPCLRLPRDYDENVAGLRMVMEIQFARSGTRHYVPIEQTPLGWSNPQVAGAYQRRFGPVRELPTFWVAGTDRRQEGYPGAAQLVAWIKGADSSAGGEKQAPAPAVDWSRVTVVVLIAQQEVGTARGAMRSGALQFVGGALRRAIADATDGKAQLEIVPERTEPTRFEAVARSGGLVPDPVVVLVLVQQLDLGLKGLIVSVLERIVSERLDEAPVEIVFERQHPDDYRLIGEALRTVEPESESSQLPWYYGLAGALVGLFKRRFLNRLDV